MLERRSIIATILALVVFILCWYAMKSGLVFELDHTVAKRIVELRLPSLTAFIRFISDMNGPPGTVSFAVATIALLLAMQYRREALYFGVTTFGAVFVYTYLKHLIMRPRPPYRIVDAVGYSFPSGHATVSMTIVAGLYFIVRSLRGKDAITSLFLGTGITWVILIGFTRIYLGAHWGSDIISGWSLGFAWANLTSLLFYKHHNVRLDSLSSKSAKLTRRRE